MNESADNRRQLASSKQYNGEQFDRIRVLGTGSFGTAIVYRRRADCSLVVLKEIDLKQFSGERERMSAINEARIMSSLKHANVIKYYNSYTTDTKLIIEMEYASIGTLANFLSFQIQPLEEQEILVIFRQITLGLNYLHSKNIIHLDLKMANIFLTIEGLVKIGDFGIAQYMSNSSNNSIQSATNLETNNNKKRQQINMSQLGTLAYSSPERCVGGQIDFKSDIWSLGCILYELITSKPLFSSESLPELIISITRIQYQPIRRKMSPVLRETFEQMIAKEVENRPSAKELLPVINQLLFKIQQQQQQRNKLIHNKHATRQANHRFDISTELALHQQLVGTSEDNMSQINYPHSFVYQVRLNARHIHLDRVNLPQTKRIKEIVKGKSHYLVLTYDNIVYGWGSKNFGQLGACGLVSTSSSAGANNNNRVVRGTRSARSSVNAKDLPLLGARFLTNSSASSSSTQTITPPTSANQQVHHHMNKQLVMSMLTDLRPTSRPFVINELNHRKIIQVAAGNDFSIFLSKTGIVMTCGDGSTGCLGRGDLKSSFTPCMVESLLNTDVVSIASGPEHVVAVCGNGKAFAWGRNAHGRLGLGGNDSDSSTRAKFVTRPQPVQLAGKHETVSIKSVFCGDKSTIFIDSKNRCWACGENRFNKLGLDIKRRFKRTKIVEKCWQASEIIALNKYKILTCNIGKNHSTFLTSDGKLIVFGQDIDNTYRLKRNIICERDSFRQISRELQTTNGKEFNLNNETKTYTTSKRSHQSMISQNKQQIINFKQSVESLARSSTKSAYGKYKLSKHQREQIDYFIKKSRSSRKISIDCAISLSCTSKFTLALSNDNRVYFWGTRSYKREDRDGFLEEELSRRKAKEVSFEPQLVANCSDECFVKIGATNSSLMSNIQLLGSDQPIIHAQDPRLTAQSLADLWILDYEPSPSLSSSASSSPCRSVERDREFSSLSSASSSCCSYLSSCSLCKHSDDSQGDSRAAPKERAFEYNAILEPQPIVSLYVPSMFNHNGCYLHLVDLFCFDEDRFYLVLDTTVKFNHHAAYSRPPSALAFNQPTSASRARIGSVDVPLLGSQNQSTLMKQAQESAQLTKKQNDVDSCANRVALDAKSSDQRIVDETTCNNQQRNFSDDSNNISSSSSSNNTSKSSIAGSCIAIPSSNNRRTDQSLKHQPTVGSIEEPRSLSTFGASHIIVGPAMQKLRQEQLALNPLSFGSTESGEDATLIEDGDDQGTIDSSLSRGVQRAFERRKRRFKLNKSESTTFTGNELDETSSMPSWVRNEYIQQQQVNNQLNGEQMFALDSSATEDTYTSQVSLTTTSSDVTLASAFKHTQSETSSKQTSPSSSSTSCLLVGSNLISAKIFKSRSQPNIRWASNTIHNKELRRASISDQLVKTEPNLLECKVYRNSEEQYNFRPQNANTSSSSSPTSSSSSNNPLIGSQKELPAQESSEPSRVVSSEQFLFELVRADSSFQAHRSITTDDLRRHHALDYHLALSRSVQLNSPLKRGKNVASSSSLASLRRSILGKLFC